MKKFFLLTGGLLILCSAVILFRDNSRLKENTSGNFSGGIEEVGRRSVWEMMRLADPATGKIPDGMRKRELQFASTLPVMRNAVARMTIPFTFRGPVNVGGRTRALAVDVSDDNIVFAGSVNGGLWRSTDQGATWTRVSSVNENQSIAWIAQDTRPGHTDTWYYATGEGIGASASGAGAYYLGNGVYKSTDGGLTWNVLPSTSSGTPQTFESVFDIMYKVVTDPSDTVNDVVYLACYGMIYRSTNGGGNWQLQRGLTSQYSYFTDVDVTSTGVAYATLSSDGAQKGIWRRDPVLGWADIKPPGWDTATYNRVVIGINPSNENEVYFLGETPNSGKMTTNYKGDPEWISLWKYTYISGDGSGAGGNWVDLSPNIPFDGTQLGNFNAQGGYNLIVRVHPTDPNVVFIGGTNLYRSTDAFTTSNNTELIGGYDPVSTIPHYGVYPNHHSDQHNVVFLPSNPDVVFNSHDGGVVKTSDVLASPVVWQDVNTGYHTSQFYTVAVDHGQNNDVIIGGLQDYGTWFTNTSDETQPWTHSALGDGAYCAIEDGGGVYYMSRQEGKVGKFTLDANGVPTAFRRIDPIGGDNYLFINPFLLDPNDNNIMYLAGGTKIWRNDDLSSIPLTGDWDTISTGWTVLPDTLPSNSMVISCLAASRQPAHRLYYGTSASKLYRVDDANSGSPVTTDISSNQFPVNAYINCIAVDPDNADNLLVVFSNYNVYSLFYSSDGGASWGKTAGNLEQNLSGSGNGPSLRWASIVPTANGKVYLVGTSVGLFGANHLAGFNTQWTHLATNEIGKMVVDMITCRASDGFVVAGVHGGGVYSAHITDTLMTGVSQPVAGIETGFSVYPNPVSSHAYIEVDIARPEKQSVQITNVSGRIVAGFPSSKLQAGLNKLTWNASNVAAGTYFIRLLEDGREAQTLKVMRN